MENPMYYAGIAEEYYNSACPSYAQNGYEKNILMDTKTEKCIFVSGDITLQGHELLFRCKRAHGNTFITLKTPKSKEEKKTVNEPIFKGIIVDATFDEYKKRLVYLPSELDYTPNYTVLKALKLSNLDAFLLEAGGKSPGYLEPYRILCMLNERATEDFGIMELLETYRICYTRLDAEGHELLEPSEQGVYIFTFSHFEKMNGGIGAVYAYKGVSKTI